MFLVRAFSDHRFLCLDHILFAALVFSGLTVWAICSESSIYCIKQFGEKGQAKIEKVEITTEHRLQIEYTYWVGTKKYTGHRFYRSMTRYKQGEIADQIHKIKAEQMYTVYYRPKHPEKAVCFITSEELWLNKKLFIALLASWAVWGLGYLQAWIWDKNRI